MDARTHSRGSGRLPFASPETLALSALVTASLGTLACSFLAPPDDHFLSSARGGAANTASGGSAPTAGALGVGGASDASGSTSSDGGSGGSASGTGGSGSTTAGGTGNNDGAGNNGVGAAGGIGSAGGTRAAGTGGATAAGAGGATTGIACDAMLIPDGPACRLPASCKELHQYAPALASGIYSIEPAPPPPSSAPSGSGASSSTPASSSASGAPSSAASASAPPAARAAKVFCDMQESGGGWTLILNEGTDFMPKTPGTDDAICYDQNCTSSVYATLPLASDVLIDVADQDITGSNYVARIRILGVNAASRGKTLREMFTSGPYFLERGDNSNLSVFTHDDQACEDVLPPDFAALVCNTCQSTDKICGKPVLTLGDADSICDPSLTFAVGASDSESESWTNCAGWPQATFLTDSDFNSFQYYPSNLRIWLR